MDKQTKEALAELTQAVKELTRAIEYERGNKYAVQPRRPDYDKPWPGAVGIIFNGTGSRAIGFEVE